jgi:hypothetical protein
VRLVASPVAGSVAVRGSRRPSPALLRGGNQRGTHHCARRGVRACRPRHPDGQGRRLPIRNVVKRVGAGLNDGA